MINFLTTHLISRVRTHAKSIYDQNYKDSRGFIWLDDVIIDGKYTIDRIDDSFAYIRDEIMPIGWYKLKPSTIFDIYNSIKKNKISITKKNDGVIIKQKPYEYT